MRIDPGVIRMVRNQVGLAGQARNPEAVVGVRRKQRNKCRRRMLRIADRNMKFVRGDHSQRRITIFPPILVADGHDFDRAGRFGRVLYGKNHARGGQEQNQNDQTRNHGPGQLHLIAAIDLRRFAAVINAAPPKFRSSVGDQGKNNHEDQPADDQNQFRQTKYRIGWG